MIHETESSREPTPFDTRYKVAVIGWNKDPSTFEHQLAERFSQYEPFDIERARIKYSEDNKSWRLRKKLPSDVSAIVLPIDFTALETMSTDGISGVSGDPLVVASCRVGRLGKFSEDVWPWLRSTPKHRLLVRSDEWDWDRNLFLEEVMRTVIDGLQNEGTRPDLTQGPDKLADLNKDRQNKTAGLLSAWSTGLSIILGLITLASTLSPAGSEDVVTPFEELAGSYAMHSTSPPTAGPNTKGSCDVLPSGRIRIVLAGSDHPSDHQLTIWGQLRSPQDRFDKAWDIDVARTESSMSGVHFRGYSNDGWHFREGPPPTLWLEQDGSITSWKLVRQDEKESRE